MIDRSRWCTVCLCASVHRDCVPDRQVQAGATWQAPQPTTDERLQQAEYTGFLPRLLSVTFITRADSTIVTGVRRLAASLSICVWFCLSARWNQNGWNYNCQSCHRDSPSQVLAHQLILSKKTKGQGHRVTGCKTLKAIERPAWDCTFIEWSAHPPSSCRCFSNDDGGHSGIVIGADGPVAPSGTC